MTYKTFEEWKAGQWLEDGEPRTKAYTEDELLLVEMGWQYGFDAGIEECAQRAEAYAYMSPNFTALAEELRAILRKTQEK